MTDEQLNAAIAEACGWVDCKVVQKATLGVCTPVAYGRPSEYGYDVVCPSFATDLNAMHEAEKHILPDIWNVYINQLARVTAAEDSSQRCFFCAPSRQRAEAFLRTLGKWEEAE
jgi:hypothetical protein